MDRYELFQANERLAYFALRKARNLILGGAV